MDKRIFDRKNNFNNFLKFYIKSTCQNEKYCIKYDLFENSVFTQEINGAHKP